MADSTPTVVSPGWRDPADTSGAPGGRPPRTGRRRKLFFLLAALLAIAGAVVGFLLYLRPAPNPVFVGLWMTEYKDPDILPIPYGEQDRAALRAFPWQGNDAFNSQEKERLVRELDRLREKPPATAVAVYLSGYVIADSEGKPFFVRLPGELSTVGEEHSIYPDARRYIGVFWSRDPRLTERLKGLASLSVVSLDEFKSAAEEAGLTRLVSLPPPQ